ncbi:MAG: rhodanese-like domain-containing protein [Bdellovibrio sp.]|nr:rhodanese-like domain-containing protein [Bdellovibrio sp.]
MREITCQELQKRIHQVRIVDVRTPEEYTGELGHIAQAELVPLGPALIDFLKSQPLNEEIVFVCRSGARSGQTTLLSEEMGFTRTFNMIGGMLKWNELKFATEGT